MGLMGRTGHMGARSIFAVSDFKGELYCPVQARYFVREFFAQIIGRLRATHFPR